jgi:peptidoglycan/xylan/chitin deacetylase (PgdA/CDA1 family)
MTDEQINHSKHIAHQRLVAAISIAFLSIVYLAGYVQWNKMVASPQHTIASAQMAALAPPPDPGRLVYAPDVAPAQVTGNEAPVIYKVPTKQPVVFLTIDDGVVRDPEAAAKMRESNVPASLFLTQQYVNHSPGYFSNMAEQTGSAIENHTVSHKDLTLYGYEDQKSQICPASDHYADVYGKRPRLFRPPYGMYNQDTARATAACGMKAVVLWSALVEDGAMHYQIGDHLRAGDIVLMHFTPSFQQDLKAFVEASKTAGLHPQLLEGWLAP